MGDAARRAVRPRDHLFRHRPPFGKPNAARAVGAAVGRNPISFVVPCHRVLGRSGALTGYHWGLARKQAIIGWEAGRTRRAKPKKETARAGLPSAGRWPLRWPDFRPGETV